MITAYQVKTNHENKVMKCLGEMDLIHVIGACKIRDMVLLRLAFIKLVSSNIHPLIKVIKYSNSSKFNKLDK